MNGFSAKMFAHVSQPYRLVVGLPTGVFHGA